MKYLEIIADTGNAETIAALAEKAEARDFRTGNVDENSMQSMRMLVSNDKMQFVLDTLHSLLDAQPNAQVIVLSVESAFPLPEEEQRKLEESASATRESLYEDAVKFARLSWNYVILVLLSTVVAAIGLLENSVAIVIGAMVIAPLLGPNLALSLGTALGDIRLVRKAMLSLFVGIVAAVTLSMIIGALWKTGDTSHELIMRTKAGWDSAVLALVSGAAAALSMTTRLSSVLVGVMVAVALLPPASAAGILFGKGNMESAIGATLLLAINIVCINIASKLVFTFKGIGPRTWLEKRKAKQVTLVYVLGWGVALCVLIAVAYMRV
jgi:uncharacterized hydrophobic protein (TIGR00341 family)